MINRKKQIGVLGVILCSILGGSAYATGSIDSIPSGVQQPTQVVQQPTQVVQQPTQVVQQPTQVVQQPTQVVQQPTQVVQQPTQVVQQPTLGAGSISKQEQGIMDTAEAMGEVYGGMGVKPEDLVEGQAFLYPIIRMVNKATAIISLGAGVVLGLITALDMFYIAVPLSRDKLDGGLAGGQNMQRGGRGRGTRGSRGMGMGGMGMGGMGMGGMGMGGMDGGMGMGMGGQQQQTGGGVSAVGRWVSDEAISACMESTNSMQEGGGFKSIITLYMKKRAFFLVMFGICATVFLTTAFTDLGVKIGLWVLTMIMGL